MLELLENRCLSHFLSHYDPRSSKRNTRDIARDLLLRDYSRERVDEFLDVRLAILQQTLVEEFNVRFDEGRPIRFEIVDSAGEGRQIRGFRPPSTTRQIAFQDSLNALTADEFELLAAVILRRLGCHEVFATPSSHDQGVDAFGHQTLIPELPYGVTHEVTWIAQAKHYLSTRVSSCDIRELVGAHELLVARAFSTVDDRYTELTLRRYAPIALVLITSEEIPYTVRRLAQNAGAFVFASSDLFEIFREECPASISVASVRRILNRERSEIPVLA